MRYGYAQLSKNEDEFSSSKLFFSKILDTDWIFIDHGKDRHKRGAMLRTVGRNDQVVLQSRSDCGLSAEEIKDLEDKLLAKKARLSFAVYEPEPESPDEEVLVTSVAGQIAPEQVTVQAKKHRSLRKPLDAGVFASLYCRWKNKEITKGEMAEKLGITYATLQSRLKSYEAGELV